jgi:V/A-type H+-transporting ATPase subunit D
MTLSKRLNFATKGETFLEFKREQLILQIKQVWKEYKAIRTEFLILLKQALLKLNNTYQEMGKYGLNLISKLSNIQYNPVVDIQYKKKAGIILSQVKYKLSREENLPAYTFENTSHYLDDLIVILNQLFTVLINFSEIEDLLFKYSYNFKRVNRRINGLKNIIIPQLKVDIKKIRDVLEEIERESYIRLKKTKDLIINQQKKI